MMNVGFVALIVRSDDILELSTNRSFEKRPATTDAEGHKMLSVVLNREKCVGYGICAEICPDVFKLDENGFAYVEGEVSGELEEAVNEACESCPEEAIIVEPTAG
jgi:ferredoxin